jgi:hypothetical protein
MVRKNPTRAEEETSIAAPEPKEIPKNKEIQCIVKCHLRKIQIMDSPEWPETIRGKVWSDGQIKKIPRDTYEKLNGFYPSKFELIREE